MSAKNKREFERRTDSQIVDFVVEGRLYRGFTENMSRDGVFIRTAGRFSEGQDISMTIESPKFDGEKRSGKIVRSSPRGIGVKLTRPGYTR
jgi:Tfp pilus assembly protein PilZ